MALWLNTLPNKRVGTHHSIVMGALQQYPFGFDNRPFGVVFVVIDTALQARCWLLAGSALVKHLWGDHYPEVGGIIRRRQEWQAEQRGGEQWF